MAKKNKLDLTSGLKTTGKSISELLYTKEKLEENIQTEPALDNREKESDEKEINEDDYLNAKDIILPFSTILRADLYIKAKRVEYWDRTSLREIIENALEEYLSGKTSTKTSLPLKERKKLKALKRPWDYRKDVSEKRKKSK